jgi:outer membrane protein assembly factor BamB
MYMATDDGVLNCIDTSTSKTVWQKRVGGSFNASPIYGDGRIYCCNREGETTVFKPGRKFDALATNTLDDGCMASPAADDRALFLRTKTHLYRIQSTAPAAE